MAFILADRVKETASAPGTGTVTLLGAASGYQSFSAGIGASNTTYYTIADQAGTNWEVGYGTIGAGGTTLARTTVLASSNSGSLVNFSSGTQDVWCDYPAQKAAIQDSLGTATVPQLATSATTNTTPVLSFNGSNTSYASGSIVANNYLQTILQNKSGTAGASTNYVLSNDLGTDSTYYGEFGMNSSVYSASTPSDFFSINNGIYVSGHDGDITVGSGNGNKYYLAWGTSGQSAHVINASGAIGLSTNLGTTPALSGTTGYGTAGQVLTSGGSSAAPTWTTPTTGTVTSVTGTAPVVSSGGATPAISMAAANTTTNGYLTSTDWNTFNNKQAAGSYLTSVTADAPLSGSGTSGSHLVIATANTTTTGALSSTDWNTFNGKQAALSSGTNIKTVGGVSLLGAGDVGTIGATYGGTAQSTYTTGDILYASGTNTLSKLAVGSTGQVLTVASGVPSWAAASGGGSNITALGLWENSATISANYTIGTGNNAQSAGPITVNTGVTVTVPTGSTWVIV